MRIGELYNEEPAYLHDNDFPTGYNRETFDQFVACDENLATTETQDILPEIQDHSDDDDGDEEEEEEPESMTYNEALWSSSDD